MLLYNKNACDSAPDGQPDPYIIEEDGKYYVYATHPDGVQLYISEDFENFRFAGFCYSHEGEHQYWAPAVTKTDGKFYMYYSTQPSGNDDAHSQAIKVAVSDTPTGPFRFVRQMCEPFSIDAHVIEYNGAHYIFYSVNDYEAERAGTYIVLDRLISPVEAEGAPVCVVRPSIDEEIFMRDRFRAGQHWHTIEGAFYLYENGTHFCMYSGSAWTNETYFVGYCTAHGQPQDLRELKWHKYPDENTYMPILSKTDRVEGTGHNSAIFRDGQWWIVYHGRDIVADGEKKPERTFRADVMKIDGDKISVELSV